MYKISAIIEKGADGMYSVRSAHYFGRNYFGGFGETVAIAKNDFLLSVEESRQSALESGDRVPIDYQVVFQYDLPSFFENFDFINVSRFAQYAGVNESKMRQYKSGVAFPSERTTRKILNAIHRIGFELSSVSL